MTSFLERLLLRGPDGRYSRDTRVAAPLTWPGTIAPSTETGEFLKRWILRGVLNKTLIGWTCANGSKRIVHNLLPGARTPKPAATTQSGSASRRGTKSSITPDGPG